MPNTPNNTRAYLAPVLNAYGARDPGVPLRYLGKADEKAKTTNLITTTFDDIVENATAPTQRDLDFSNIYLPGGNDTIKPVAFNTYHGGDENSVQPILYNAADANETSPEAYIHETVPVEYPDVEVYRTPLAIVIFLGELKRRSFIPQGIDGERLTPLTITDTGDTAEDTVIGTETPSEDKPSDDTTERDLDFTDISIDGADEPEPSPTQQTPSPTENSVSAEQATASARETWGGSANNEPLSTPDTPQPTANSSTTTEATTSETDTTDPVSFSESTQTRTVTEDTEPEQPSTQPTDGRPEQPQRTTSPPRGPSTTASRPSPDEIHLPIFTHLLNAAKTTGGYASSGASFVAYTLLGLLQHTVYLFEILSAFTVLVYLVNIVHKLIVPASIIDGMTTGALGERIGVIITTTPNYAILFLVFIFAAAIVDTATGFGRYEQSTHSPAEL